MNILNHPSIASEWLSEPATFLTINAVAAPTDEEAQARALPQLRAMARLRSNKPVVNSCITSRA